MRKSLIFVALIAAAGLAGCSEERDDRFVATWDLQSLPATVTFKADGTAEVKYSYKRPLYSRFFWRTEDDSTLVIIEHGEEGERGGPNASKYAFEGNVVTLHFREFTVFSNSKKVIMERRIL